MLRFFAPDVTSGQIIVASYCAFTSHCAKRGAELSCRFKIFRVKLYLPPHPMKMYTARSLALRFRWTGRRSINSSA